MKIEPIHKFLYTQYKDIQIYINIYVYWPVGVWKGNHLKKDPKSIQKDNNQIEPYVLLKKLI